MLEQKHFNQPLAVVSIVYIYTSLFVSPELSSGRDLVIQMSVRRAPCAVRRPPSAVRRPWFFVRSISREPYDLP